MKQNPFNLDQKSILVTGASSGIGREIAITLDQAGASVVCAGRNEAELNSTLEILDDTERKHLSISADLGIEEEIEFLVNQSPILDGVVFNAGMIKTSPLKYLKTQDLKALFDVNVSGAILLLKQLLKKKKLKNGGSIVFISSVSSSKAIKANSVYSASKGAINSFAHAIALELSGKRIRVNTILPGFIETKLLEKSSLGKEQVEDHLKNYPLGRFGEPKDVAYLAAYLQSDMAAWMTGAEIKVDGGFSL